MAKVAFTAPGYTIAEIFTRVGAIMGWDSTGTLENVAIEEAITAAGQAACTWEGRIWWWAKKRRPFKTLKATITTIARVTNVVTVTTAAVHGIVAGSEVKIDGTTAATTAFDGTFTALTIPSTTTFTYTDNAADDNTTLGYVYVAGYPLQTVNSALLQDIWAPIKVWIDTDYYLAKWSKDQYDDWAVMDWSVGQPYAYAIAGERYYDTTGSLFHPGTLIYLAPIPDTEYVINVSYVRRHSKITDGASGSLDEALIVPAEYQGSVYVDGAVYLLKNNTTDPTALQNSARFVSAMKRMAASDPEVNYDAQTGIGFPADTKVFTTAGGLSV